VPAVQVIRGRLARSADDGALDVAIAHELLRRVGRGDLGEVLRIYRPASPTVAFGRRDTLLPGFSAAARAARDAGFVPVIRAPGGRCVAYTGRALVVDHARPDPDAFTGMDARFRTFGALWARLLSAHGIDARVGEVPGEYCPGSFSVNARGRAKLVGTAQRVVRRGWLFSAVLVYDDADALRPLLGRIYERLDLPFDPASVGSVRLERPGLELDALEEALLAAYADRDVLVPAALDEDVVEAAAASLDDHRTG
jgi:octanoyl-[GcvH]:protein N-octanoyltransferase